MPALLPPQQYGFGPGQSFFPNPFTQPPAIPATPPLVPGSPAMQAFMQAARAGGENNGGAGPEGVPGAESASMPGLPSMGLGRVGEAFSDPSIQSANRAMQSPAGMLGMGLGSAALGLPGAVASTLGRATVGSMAAGEIDPNRGPLGAFTDAVKAALGYDPVMGRMESLADIKTDAELEAEHAKAKEEATIAAMVAAIAPASARGMFSANTPTGLPAGASFTGPLGNVPGPGQAVNIGEHPSFAGSEPTYGGPDPTGAPPGVEGPPGPTGMGSDNDAGGGRGPTGGGEVGTPGDHDPWHKGGVIPGRGEKKVRVLGGEGVLNMRAQAHIGAANLHMLNHSAKARQHAIRALTSLKGK